MYPAEPNPIVVERMSEGATPPGPNAVEKEEIARFTKLTVEIKEEARDADEIYPAEPNPIVVESISEGETPPGPKAVEKDEIDVLIKFVVEMSD